jgi:hypothetical protein
MSTEQDPDHDRPRPGPRPTPEGRDSADTPARDETSGPARDGENDGGDLTYGEDDSQDFVDRDKIDFDPAEGLYTGSAVDGDSDIPGPNEAEIREAQENLGDDQDGDAGAKAAAEKFIEENDVDLEEAKKGEAIAGSAQSSGSKADDA